MRLILPKTKQLLGKTDGPTMQMAHPLTALAGLQKPCLAQVMDQSFVTKNQDQDKHSQAPAVIASATWGFKIQPNAAGF